MASTALPLSDRSGTSASPPSASSASRLIFFMRFSLMPGAVDLVYRSLLMYCVFISHGSAATERALAEPRPPAAAASSSTSSAASAGSMGSGFSGTRYSSGCRRST